MTQLSKTYRLSVYDLDALRTKRGTLSDGTVLLLPAGPDESLAGSADAPIFGLARDRDAVGRHPSAEEFALIAPHLPVDANAVTPVTDPDQIARRKAYARETLQAAPTPPGPLFSGPSYDYQTPHAWSVSGFLGRLLALPDADAQELAGSYVRVSAGSPTFLDMLAAVRASGYGSPDAIGIDLDEADAARLVREQAEEDAVRRNAEEAIRKYAYSGLLIIACSTPRPRDSVDGQRFGTVPHGVPAAIAHAIYGGLMIPPSNYEIDGCPAWVFRVPLGFEDVLVFPRAAGHFLPSKTEILLTRGEYAALPIADLSMDGMVRKALDALKVEGMIDLRPLGEADLIGMDREDSEALINCARERAAELVPFCGRGVTDVQSIPGLAKAAVCSEFGTRFDPSIAAEIIHTAYDAHWTSRTPGTKRPDGSIVAGSFEDWSIADIFRMCVAAANGQRMHSPGFAVDKAPTFLERAAAKISAPDPWRSVLLRALDGKPHARNADLFAALDAAGHPAVDNPTNRKRLFAVMSGLGWSKKDVPIDGQRTKAWIPAEVTP